MGQEPARADPCDPAVKDEEEYDHGRIGYGRHARFTPLALALLLIAGPTIAGIARLRDEDGTADGPRLSDRLAIRNGRRGPRRPRFCPAAKSIAFGW